MNRLLVLIALICLLPSCYTGKKIADIRSGGLDTIPGIQKNAPQDYISGNETFLSYRKDGLLQVKPSNVIDFQLTETEKYVKQKYQKEMVTKGKHESRRERKARRKKERAEAKEKGLKGKGKHESCREKKERRKKERAEWKASREKQKKEKVKHESCREKKERLKKERAERKKEMKERKVMAKKAKSDRKAAHYRPTEHKYAYAELSKYYYRFLPGNGVLDFFLAMYPPCWPALLPVHEKKELTTETCKYSNHCAGVKYPKKILLDASIYCKRDKIGEPVHVWENLPAEITMDSYKVKIRGGKSQIGAVTHNTGTKNGKLYHDFTITPANGSFTKNSHVWIIMNVSVLPISAGAPVTPVSNDQQPARMNKTNNTDKSVTMPAQPAAPVTHNDEVPSAQPAKTTPAITAVKSDTVASPPDLPVNEPVSKTHAAEPVAIAKFAEEDKSMNNSDEEYHIVVHGETLYGIAKQYGVTVADLQKWNDLTSAIKSGMKLRVSKGTSQSVPKRKETAATGVKYHIVTSGQTLYSISRMYGITVQQLMEWNKLSNNNIEVGQQLIVGK